MDTVNRVVPQLVRDGRVIRPALGIEADDRLNQRLAQLRGVSGVVILRVAPGSAAANAGLKGATLSSDGGIVPGDIILAIGGKAVDSLGRLISRLVDFKVGDTVKVTLRRGERTVDVPVTLQAGA